MGDILMSVMLFSVPGFVVGYVVGRAVSVAMQ